MSLQELKKVAEDVEAGIAGYAILYHVKCDNYLVLAVYDVTGEFIKSFMNRNVFDYKKSENFGAVWVICDIEPRTVDYPGDVVKPPKSLMTPIKVEQLKGLEEVEPKMTQLRETFNQAREILNL
jgi:hypothetical protein